MKAIISLRKCCPFFARSIPQGLPLLLSRSQPSSYVGPFWPGEYFCPGWIPNRVTFTVIRVLEKRLCIYGWHAHVCVYFYRKARAGEIYWTLVAAAAAARERSQLWPELEWLVGLVVVAGVTTKAFWLFLTSPPYIRYIHVLLCVVFVHIRTEGTRVTHGPWRMAYPGHKLPPWKLWKTTTVPFCVCLSWSSSSESYERAREREKNTKSFPQMFT